MPYVLDVEHEKRRCYSCKAASAQPISMPDATAVQTAAKPLKEPVEGRGQEQAADLLVAQYIAASELQLPSREEQQQTQLSHLSWAELRQSKPEPGAPRQAISQPNYTNRIPQFLLDLEYCTDTKGDNFLYAWRVVKHLPRPPSLPAFLKESVLNDKSLRENDTNVLTMPSHTVLNHLGIKSIKNGILVISGTTRYKRKVSNCL
jgi:hypothetical protein